MRLAGRTDVLPRCVAQGSMRPSDPSSIPVTSPSPTAVLGRPGSAAGRFWRAGARLGQTATVARRHRRWIREAEPARRGGNELPTPGRRHATPWAGPESMSEQECVRLVIDGLRTGRSRPRSGFRTRRSKSTSRACLRVKTGAHSRTSLPAVVSHAPRQPRHYVVTPRGYVLFPMSRGLSPGIMAARARQRSG